MTSGDCARIKKWVSLLWETRDPSLQVWLPRAALSLVASPQVRCEKLPPCGCSFFFRSLCLFLVTVLAVPRPGVSEERDGVSQQCCAGAARGSGLRAEVLPAGPGAPSRPHRLPLGPRAVGAAGNYISQAAPRRAAPGPAPPARAGQR